MEKKKNHQKYIGSDQKRTMKPGWGGRGGSKRKLEQVGTLNETEETNADIIIQ